ncbi:MAG: hypothetical protein ACTSYS_09655 [Promethearchaeota archaeon]
MTEEFLYWDVIFDGGDPGPSDDFSLKFVDGSALIGEPLLKNEFLDDLIFLIKKYDHYNVIGNIKKIIDDAGDDQSDKNIYALLGILKNELKVGFLLGNVTENELDFWHVAAVWPEDFAVEIVKNQEIFKNALLLILDKPDEWSRVDLITPVYKKTRTSNITI